MFFTLAGLPPLEQKSWGENCDTTSVSQHNFLSSISTL